MGRLARSDGKRQHDRGDNRESDNYDRGHEIHTCTLEALSARRHDRGDGQETPSNDQRGKGHQLKGRPRPTWGDGRGSHTEGCQSDEADAVQCGRVGLPNGEGLTRNGNTLTRDYDTRWSFWSPHLRWWFLCLRGSHYELRGNSRVAPTRLDAEAVLAQESKRSALHHRQCRATRERRSWNRSRVANRGSPRIWMTNSPGSLMAGAFLCPAAAPIGT
jgi:hypothetical protein